MLSVEAAAYLDLATDFINSKEFKRKYDSVHKEFQGGSGSLIFDLADQTDAFILAAEARLDSKDEMRALLLDTDPKVVFCTGLRFFNVMLWLKSRWKRESGLPIVRERALSSALIDGWRIVSNPPTHCS
mgnify:CR=1 FL=1